MKLTVWKPRDFNNSDKQECVMYTQRMHRTGDWYIAQHMRYLAKGQQLTLVCETAAWMQLHTLHSQITPRIGPYAA